MNEQHKIELIEKIRRSRELLQTEIRKIIIGQQKTIDSIITALLCGGNCLLIGVPGLAKTLTVKTIAQALDLDFKRVQFTPDLMPSDILGSEFLQIDKESGARYFVFNKGPVFTNILLADEINRTPPKTQSALLEAMQELSVTTGGSKYSLDTPFFVLATQNPIEQEGTYPLPEAQLDRFMFSVKIGYPTFEEEQQIIKSTTYNTTVPVKSVLSKNDILEAQQIVRDILISDELIDYILKLVRATRPELSDIEEIKKNVSWGAGPRASQYLTLAAKTNALLSGRMHCIKDDILIHLNNILEHRILLNFNALAENISVGNIIDIIKTKIK